jgi:hypothetical protein
MSHGNREAIAGPEHDIAARHEPAPAAEDAQHQTALPEPKALDCLAHEWSASGDSDLSQVGPSHGALVLGRRHFSFK